MKKTITKCVLMLLFLSIFSSFVFAEFSDSKIISVSLVNQDPDPAIAGDIVEIRLGVENRGGVAAENLILEIILEYPFTMVPGESEIHKVGTIKAYQTESDMKIVKFKIRVDRDTTAGEYELKIRNYEEGKEGISTTRSFSIDVESKECAEVIYIDQVELLPGKITPLKFTVNNVGSAPLRELIFQWENEDDIVLPVGSDNTKYIKYIDIGDSAELEFDVIASVNAVPDLYKLDLTLTYDDPITGEEKEINTKAGIYVGGKTDFDVVYSGSSNGEYSFSISNIGSVSASSVTVRIPEQQEWKVSGSNSVIIGNLNEGDYTIAGFKLIQRTGTIASKTESTNTQSQRTQIMQDSKIQVEIAYTDSRGNRETITKEVAVVAAQSGDGTTTAKAGRFGAKGGNQSALQQVWTNGKWIIIGALILVLFLVVRRKYKKTKMKVPDYTYKQTIKDMFRFKKKTIKK